MGSARRNARSCSRPASPPRRTAAGSGSRWCSASFTTTAARSRSTTGRAAVPRSAFECPWLPSRCPRAAWTERRADMPSLLIVDDEANIRSSLQGALGREGYDVDVAATLAEARAKLRDAFDVVLLDVGFPSGSGLDLLAEIAAGTPDTVVVMMSGHASIDAAVTATRLGAFDFLEKPISLERLLVLLRNATATQALRSENRRLQKTWALPIVGRSTAIRKLLDEIERAGPSTARVLIQGEHGTGKELVARALHASGPRRAMPFVAVNCSAIPDELIESELFGHERGAFTGATQSRRGRFE